MLVLDITVIKQLTECSCQHGLSENKDSNGI